MTRIRKKTMNYVQGWKVVLMYRYWRISGLLNDYLMNKVGHLFLEACHLRSFHKKCCSIHEIVAATIGFNVKGS
jgi:hypothetical protein